MPSQSRITTEDDAAAAAAAVEIEDKEEAESLSEFECSVAEGVESKVDDAIIIEDKHNGEAEGDDDSAGGEKVVGFLVKKFSFCCEPSN
jgi:hypothetical protein